MELDGKNKMSKSAGNTIGLFESPESIWEKLRPAATDPARVTRKDPGTPEICNIFTLHQGFSPPETVAEVAHKCRTAGWGCLDCKRVLADNIIATLKPMRERAEALKRDPAGVMKRLRLGEVALAVPAVPATRDFPHQLEVLDLILTDRD